MILCLQESQWSHFHDLNWYFLCISSTYYRISQLSPIIKWHIMLTCLLTLNMLHNWSRSGRLEPWKLLVPAAMDWTDGEIKNYFQHRKYLTLRTKYLNPKAVRLQGVTMEHLNWNECFVINPKNMTICWLMQKSIRDQLLEHADFSIAFNKIQISKSSCKMKTLFKPIIPRRLIKSKS